jgi:hypothetical protein
MNTPNFSMEFNKNNMNYDCLVRLIVLPIFISLLPLSDVSAETFFSINYYTVGQKAYTGITPLNGVIRIPKEKIEPDKCVEAIEQLSYTHNDVRKFSQCTPQMAELLGNYGDKVADLLDFEGDWLTRKIAVLEMGKEGKAFLFIELSYGGSGGSENSWSLYLIRNNKHEFLRLSAPFMSGIEVTPGGDFGYKKDCAKKNISQCIDEIFYPKKNAFQMLFTDKGIITQPLPKDAKIPDPIW